jgi:hypothetical protein
MATPPDEIRRLENEIRRLRAELERTREEREEERRVPPAVLRRLPPPPPSRPGESPRSFIARRREYYERLPELIEELEEETEGEIEQPPFRTAVPPPSREPNESMGAFIARRRKYYAQQRAALKEQAMREQMAAMAIPQEMLPAVPTEPEPGETREAFLLRQRAALEERERAAAAIAAERRAQARSAASSTLTEEETMAMAQRRAERRTARAVRMARGILRQRAAAQKIEIPFIKGDEESDAAFDVRVAEATLQKEKAERAWLDAIHALENVLRRPDVELATRHTAAGAIPPSPKFRAAVAAQKALAAAVLEVFYNPTEYGLTEEGLTQEEVRERRAAEMVPGVPIVNIEATIDNYSRSKRDADAIVRTALDMLGHQYSQIDQWIAFNFLSNIGQLPQDFSASMIPQVPGDEFERQAKDYLERRGGFIGPVDHSAEITPTVLEAGPPAVLGPPRPTDPQEIINEAVDDMEGNYRRAQNSMNGDIATLAGAYTSGALNSAQRAAIEQFASQNGITLPAASEIPAAPEERFANNSNVQGVIAEIGRLRNMNTPESLSALRVLVARLAAESVSDNPDVAAQALYILQQTGLV